jgi:hypothetical protein
MGRMSDGMGTERPGDGRSGVLGRLASGGGNRSSFVYLVVGVVALVLLILLAIVYFSASERERTSPPICTDITLQRAERAVLGGEVERLTIVYDETPRTPTSDRYGPVLAKLDFTDGSCSNLPQGVANQEVVYTIAGVIAFYNENTEEQKVEVVYQTGTLADELFARPTEPPTVTPTPEPTTPPTATATPTAPATEAPSPTAPATPAGRGTPVASPIASPAVTPTLPPTEGPPPTEVSLP